MKKGFFAALLLLLSVVLLAGCVGTGWVERTASPLPSGATPDPTATVNPAKTPEQLISAEEAAQLLGVGSIAAQSPDATPLPNSIPMDGMTFAFYNAGDGMFLQVALYQRIEDNKNIKFPKDVYERLKRNTVSPVAVEGIGDDAFIAPPGLHMLVDGYYVMIAVGDPADTKNVEILKKAGELVAGKLAK